MLRTGYCNIRVFTTSKPFDRLFLSDLSEHSGGSRFLRYVKETRFDDSFGVAVYDRALSGEELERLTALGRQPVLESFER